MNEVSKWFMKSKTIWGVFITTFTAVFGALGPLINLPISAGDLVTIDTHVSAIIDAVGGIFGVVMIVYGRMTAEKKLFVVAPSDPA